MWNDTDTPLAYLITFRTYGTWLHGDERGSVSRHKNVYKSSKLGFEPTWSAINRDRMTADAVVLNARQRRCVKRAIKETCEIRKWILLALNVRTNHGHAVVAAGSKGPGIVLNALKANATRVMRSDGCWASNKSPWVDKGSTRYLWNDNSVWLACDYVNNGQGDDLPDFD